MATNEKLNAKARHELDQILLQLSTGEERQRAAMNLLVLCSGVLLWVKRDETAEDGPDHPCYSLAILSARELVLMAQSVSAALAVNTVSLPQDQRDVLAAAGVMAREELLTRFERLEAEAAGQAVI